MNAPQEIHQLRPSGIQTAACGRRFQRKTHLHIGSAECVPGKPPGRGQLVIQVIQVLGNLRLDEDTFDLVRDIVGLW